MKILELNEYDGLLVQIKWFNHLPNNYKKNILDEFENEYIHIVQIIHSSK